MAHFHTKKKKGRPYLYVREIARVNGQPKVVWQKYIGSPERVVNLVEGQGGDDVKLSVEEFGALWVANQMDADVDLVGIIDEVVPHGDREKGPTVGEYFLYAVLNRMVDATSKRALPDWYGSTAVQSIRPVDVDKLSSQKYWAKWDRVSAKAVDEIGQRFFRRIWELERPNADCVMFDTTNYYTFMASDTNSELAKRGKNKAGRHNLRQVGLGLLVARDSRLPLYHSVYPGNRHDSKEFCRIMDEMFGVVVGLDNTKERLTVVVDKGMNSEDNFAWLDEHPRVHFVTTYSPYFADDLAATPMEKFVPINTKRNRQLEQDGHELDRMTAYRTKEEFWGKERAVVVTHYPPTARKQTYTFQAKLAQLKEELLVMRSKVNQGAPQWRDEDKVKERYLRLCERLHVSSSYYNFNFSTKRKSLKMSFRKDQYRVRRKQHTFGKTIIVTDNTDWTTEEIVEANLDRWEVEDSFRQSNHDDLVSARPIRHWTDSKIRCHLLTCVIALTYLRRLELRLASAGVHRTAAAVMKDLHRLHSVLSIRAGSRKPHRALEQPSKTQAEVLQALGYRVDEGGVLQPLLP